jgi:hypothetical protein
MGAGGGPPNGARIVHHGTDELLIQQNTIPDGEIATPVQERPQHAQALCRFLSHLIDVFRPGEPFNQRYHKVTGFIESLDWLPDEPSQSGLLDAPSLCEEPSGALRDSYGDPTLAQPPLEVFENNVQVFVEKRRLTGLGYDGRVIRVERQFNAPGRLGHLVHIQAE